LLSRAGRTLHEVQSHLDREGASDLVVELVIKSVHSPSIFVEAVELGSALLEGGNPIIQKSMYSKLMGGDLSQAFFKVCLHLLLVKCLFNCNETVGIIVYTFVCTCMEERISYSYTSQKTV
jgi:hypothetical protein